MDQETIDNVSEQLGSLIRKLEPEVGTVIMYELLIFHLNELRCTREEVTGVA